MATPLGAVDLARVDGAARSNGAERPSAVARVLMPPSVLLPNTPEAGIEEGRKIFSRARRRNLRFSGWRETYFERLTGAVELKTGREAIGPNRILEIVQKLGTWDKDVAAALYAHTGIPRDKLRTRGAPCLQYIQFEPVAGNGLNLFAVYRSHDYFHKALGNLIGLSRVLAFACKHSGRTAGRLTVFSIHPTAESSKQRLKSYATAVASALGI